MGCPESERRRNVVTLTYTRIRITSALERHHHQVDVPLHFTAVSADQTRDIPSSSPLLLVTIVSGQNAWQSTQPDNHSLPEAYRHHRVRAWHEADLLNTPPVSPSERVSKLATSRTGVHKMLFVYLKAAGPAPDDMLPGAVSSGPYAQLRREIVAWCFPRRMSLVTSSIAARRESPAGLPLTQRKRCVSLIAHA